MRISIACAHKHLLGIPEEYIYKEAKDFLSDLALRSGSAPGRKSGLCLWGYVGNYTLAEEFAEILKPFWEDILRDDEDWDGPSASQRILIFHKNEHWAKARAIEIFWDDDRSPNRTLLYQQHTLPFSWDAANG